MEIPYEILIKYCKNECNIQEKRFIEDWLAADDNNLNTFLDLQKEWIYINQPSYVIPDKEAVWKQICNKTDYKQYLEKETSIRKKHSIPYTMWALTAVLILSLLTISGYLINNAYRPKSFTYISTQWGEKSQAILADGTKIWLNSKSKLSFASDYNDKNRSIEAHGELFFDVAHDQNKPFIVDIGKVKIRVLGTSFNVSNYESDDFFEISLIEGEVEVLDVKKNKHMFNLSPSQRAHINKHNLKYEIINEDTEEAKLWTANKLLIHNATIYTAIKKLERWYGVNISYTQLDESKRYTFLLNTESLREFLDLFNKITPIEYEIYDNSVKIKGK